MKFIVTVKEVWDQMVEIEAANEQEAKEKVVGGQGLYLDAPGGFAYSRTLDSDGWTIEEAE